MKNTRRSHLNNPYRNRRKEKGKRKRKQKEEMKTTSRFRKWLDAVKKFCQNVMGGINNDN